MNVTEYCETKLEYTDTQSTTACMKMINQSTTTEKRNMTWDRHTKTVEYQKDATTRLSHRKLNGDQSQGRHFDT